MNKRDSAREYWQKHYQSFKTAGISQREYCRNNDLGYFAFNKWKSKFDQENRSTALQQLPIKYYPTQSEKFEIVLQGNIKIAIPDNFSENTLKRIMSVLSDAK